MATDMKDCMAQTMDSVTKGIEAGLDAGRKAQAAWFDAFSAFTANQPAFDRFFAGPTPFPAPWMSFWADNAKATVDCFDAGWKTTVGVVRTACETALDNGKQDCTQAAKTICDAAFDASKSNFNTLSDASRSGFERWTAFVSGSQGNGSATKGGAKSSK
ncbi:MAG: hypothetical protein ACE5E5_03915 [Phycisphaerae bacterium]